jgi:plastocyanin
MTTIVGARRGWQAIATALAIVALGSALAGIHDEIASADNGAHASRTATVDIVNFAFRPGTLTIGAGSKVVFSNTSSRRHTATRKGSFSTGRIKPGKSASIGFNQKGTFAYHCTIHPFMHGKIVVD